MGQHIELSYRVILTWLYQFWLFSFQTAKNWGYGPRNWTADLLRFEDYHELVSGVSPDTHGLKITPVVSFLRLAIYLVLPMRGHFLRLHLSAVGLSTHLPFAMSLSQTHQLRLCAIRTTRRPGELGHAPHTHQALRKRSVTASKATILALSELQTFQ
jgi:hypothetical protein